MPSQLSSRTTSRVKAALRTQPVKQEALRLGVLFVALAAAVQIAFFKESPIVVLRVVLGIFFLFVLPGYGVLYAWRERLGFLERAVGGALLFAGMFLVLTYFVGFVGVNVNLAIWIVPLIGYAAFIIQLVAPHQHGKSRAD